MAGPAPRIIVQKSSGTWWKVLLAFFGGVVLGVGGVVGGVAAAGAYVKTGDIISTVGGDPDKILTPEYQEKTILDIVMEAVGGNIKVESLGDVAKITPALDPYVDGLIEQLSGFGVKVTMEEIYSWPFSELPDRLIETVKGVTLISFLSADRVDDPDPIVKYLCYQTDDHGEYILDGEGHMIPHTINDLMSNSSFIQSKIDNLRIGTLFSEADINNSDLLKAIQDMTISDLSADGAFDDIEVAAVVGDSNHSKIVEAFRRDHVTIGGIASAVDNLYLDDVFDYDNFDSLPSVLKKLLAKEANGTFPGQLAEPNPYGLTKMVFGSDGYPVEYDYVIFSDGTDEHKTDYIPFSKIVDVGGIKTETGFIDKEVITINDDLSVSFSGHEDRDANAQVVSININKPSTWEHVYAFSCNKPAKVKDLDSVIDSLKLKDVMAIKPGDSLWKVRNEPISDGDSLFNSIKDNLTLQDIMPDYASTKFIKALPGTTTIANLASAFEDMQLIVAFEDNIYDESGNLKSMWKYLLIEPGEPWINGNPNASTHPLDTYACASYTVGGTGEPGDNKGFDQLIDNMTENMNNAEIRRLVTDQIVSLDEDTFVNKPIPFFYYPALATSPVRTRYPTLYDTQALTFGHLTIEEFSTMIATYNPSLP